MIFNNKRQSHNGRIPFSIFSGNWVRWWLLGQVNDLMVGCYKILSQNMKFLTNLKLNVYIYFKIVFKFMLIDIHTFITDFDKLHLINMIHHLFLVPEVMQNTFKIYSHRIFFVQQDIFKKLNSVKIFIKFKKDYLLKLMLFNNLNKPVKSVNILKFDT